MRIWFENAAELLPGIELLAPVLHLEICADAPELTVCCVPADEDVVRVTYAADRAEIAWGGGKSRFFRGLGLLIEAIEDGKTEFVCEQHPSFEKNGAMFDMSRNAVMRPETVKFILCRMALMGLSTFMLYTEDTYEVENWPYFGHMRGRYTKAEIKDLDAYALKLGIELVPCIQTLGHMEMALKWAAHAPLRDSLEVLLVGEEETYRLIDDMFRTISECFTTRRIHVGMDESESMGHGRYFTKHGYRPGFDIFCEHLNRVTELAEKYGFHMMMWCDMIMKMASKTHSYYDLEAEVPADVAAKFPRNVDQVYWDYRHMEPEFNETMMKKLQPVTDRVIWAGAIVEYIGPCPRYAQSIPATIAGMTASKNAGISEVNVTIWHNGCEAHLMTSMPGLQLFAELDYTGVYDKDAWAKRTRFCCEVDLDDILAIEEIDHPDGKPEGNASRCLVFNDPLIGLMDRHVRGLDAATYYQKMRTRFENLKPMHPIYEPTFETFRCMIDLLETRSDYGLRLTDAYLANDRAALEALCTEAQAQIGQIEKLRLAHRKAWLLHNKAFGWEVMDSRYGTMEIRMKTVIDRVQDFLNGDIAHIEELEEPRLWFDGRGSQAQQVQSDEIATSEEADTVENSLPFCYNRFQRIYTAGVSYVHSGQGG